MSKWEKVKLGDICTYQSSTIKQSDLQEINGEYPIYGASGFIKNVNFYKQDKPYVAVVKDGAGVGRVMQLPAFSSIIGTMQYIIPNSDTDVKYLAYAMEHMNLSKYYTGATIPHIYFRDYKNEHDFVAQQQITSTLDKLQSIIAHRKQQLAKLDELVKGRFVEMFGDPTTNPNGYPVKAMSEIAEYWNGLTYKPEDVTENGTIVLRSSNIQNMQLEFTDIVRVNCKIVDKKYVHENDILMCSRNGSAKLVGKVALIHELDEPMSFGAFMMIIRSQYYPYLMTYFQHPAFRSQITTGATTTINQITGNMMNKVVLPVPDMSMVDQFAAFVTQVDKSKVVVQKALDEAQLLFDSLMQEYFG